MAAVRGKGENVTFSTEQMLRPELGREERLLWSDMPKQGVCFRTSDFLAVPFSLMWAGFAFFWEYSVSSAKDAPVFMMLWGIPFVLIGLYMIVGRFFADAYLRRRTYYGVTDQRIIILSGLFTRQVKSLPLTTLSDITFSERSDRSGTITFGPNNFGFSMMAGTPWPGTSGRMPPAFDLIGDARHVYALIREAQQSARAAKAA
ncbi:PH domain-containing protein [Dyella sp. OK004]|nr:PH domain-containing protein [Dyella sp. OK004]